MDPVFGEGTDVAVNDGASSAFVDIDDTTNIVPPAETVVVLERNRVSATTIVERAFSTRKDPGTFSFTYECGLTKFDRMEDLKGVSKSWRLTYTDDLRIAFSGTLISNVPDAVQGGVITSATVTVQLTSLLAISDATP